MSIKEFFDLLLEDVTSFKYELGIVTFEYENKIHEVNIFKNLSKQYQEIFNPENI